MAVTKTVYEGPEDEIVFIDEFGVRRAQRLTYTPNFNNVEVSEIGGLGLIETIPELITTTTNLDTNDWGTTDTLAMVMGEKAARPYNSGVINYYQITEADFGNAIVDILVQVQEDSTLRRTRYLPNQYLTGFTLTYNVDGVASENYTFAGDQDYDFVGAWADVRSYRGKYATPGSFQISGFLTVANCTGIFITCNNQIVSTGNQITFAAGGSNTLVSSTNYTGFDSSAKLRFVGAKWPSADTFAQRVTAAYVNTPGYGAIMGRQVYIYLGDSTMTEATKVKALRLQSVSIAADLGRTDLKELGNETLVGKILNIPIRINITCEASDSDLETYARLVGGATLTAWNTYQGTPAGTQSYVQLKSSLLANGTKNMIVDIYKERASATTMLKKITITGLFVSGKSGEISSTARGSLTWNLQGSYITITGYNVNPLT
jgi:hypothetical protein